MRPLHIVAGLGLAAAAAIALEPPAILPPGAGHAVALALATIVLLATGVVPEHVTAILFFAAATVFAVAPTGVVFSGFQSTAFWLVFGGLIISVAVSRTGLAERLSVAIGRRLGGSYPRMIVGTAVIGLVLAFLMPGTMGRVMVMLPIVLALADSHGFGPGSNGRAGMVLTMSFVTMMPAFAILPATVPAMVLTGASETLYGISPVYGGWLLLHFPVLGLLKTAAIVLLVLWLLPDRPTEATAGPGEVAQPGRRVGWMAVLLCIALAFWCTDFLHHISPAWVALGVAAVCVLPRIGMIRPVEFNQQVAWGSLFYVAGMLGLGALFAHTGVAEVLAAEALERLQLHPDNPAWTFFSVSGISAVLAMAATQPGIPAVMTPLAGAIAGAAGLPVESVLMMIVVGFSTVVLPYQTPPLIVAAQLGRVRLAQASRLCFAVFLVTALVLLPLDYFWWQALGRFG